MCAVATAVAVIFIQQTQTELYVTERVDVDQYGEKFRKLSFLLKKKNRSGK